MNKRISEASPQEIAEAYKNKVPLLIWNYRKASIGYNIDYDTGETELFCRFGLKMAERYNLGFEYRIYDSNKNRKKRLSKRVSDIVRSGKAQFITLTFNDTFFSRSTSEITRRRYISRFLKEQCEQYVANIDYGERQDCTHREHYHALVIPKQERIDYKPYCAFFDKSRIFAEQVRISGKSEISIALYINKLTNHSLKASGKCKRLIYSRGI